MGDGKKGYFEKTTTDSRTCSLLPLIVLLFPDGRLKIVADEKLTLKELRLQNTLEKPAPGINTPKTPFLFVMICNVNEEAQKQKSTGYQP